MLACSRIGGITARLQQGVPADNKAVLAICLMILAYDVLNIILVTGSIVIDTRDPFWECFVRTFYFERRAILPQRTFLTIVAMLLTSHMGNIAFLIVFAGVISLRFQNIFQRELAVRTEEAETDPLTDTYNMRYLRRWLSTKIGTADDSKSHCSFIFADVDGLKTVNDKYGHETGNSLLVHVAQILVANVRSKDRVARYGGDEFVVACPDTDLAQATSVAMRILEASNKQPFVANGSKIAFGISMGVASWPEHGETAFDIIRMADKAMYLAKKSGGNTLRSAANL
ncbi:MAG TPA: GGDEF domain-containing protein [Firmicutes bacterium]|nr:GGDEF domain-containing protein [Candidatus Fermentithermobacillaceae bacterium]